MGAKNLKAIVAVGKDFAIVPKMKKEFDAAKRQALKYINQNVVTSDWYRNYGTPANVRFCNKGGILPVNNFTQGSSDKAMQISGEQMRAKHATEPHTCKPCSILCGKQGTFGDVSLVAPEYETVALLGSNLGIFDPVKIAEWNHLCAETGMDTISTGNVIGWVMEATQKGLIQSNLRFCEPDPIADAIKDIAHGRGLGQEMALGVRAIAKKHGGEGFAIHVKGLELPGYDPRGSFGQGLSYAVANRGACHLSATMFAQEVFFDLLNPYRLRAKANFVKFFEDLYCCINSLHGCLFTAYAYILESPLTKYTPKPLLGFIMQNLPEVAVGLVDSSLYRRLWASIVGVDISNAEYLLAGNRIHVLERYMNTREGISRKDDTLPARLLEEGRECDPQKRSVPLSEMLDKYYALRGYDKDGIPTPATLKRLGIAAA
jgi:aldehyde:ferredoxin oxidoreductase